MSNSSSPKLTWLAWFEDNPQAEPAISLQAATAHFHKRFGQAPNRAQVPTAWPENVCLPGLTLERQQRYIRPRHIHLAYDPDLTAQTQAGQETTLEANLT